MTAQAGDRIFFRGEQCVLFSCPLEQHTDAECPLPSFAPISTGNWRGYIASWSIEDDCLLLTNIIGWIAGTQLGGWGEVQVGWDLVFPHRPPPIPADWFSGDLCVPQGEQLEYVHAGFGSVHAQDIILALYQGKVVLCDLYENALGPGILNVISRLVRSELLTRPVGLFGEEEWAFISAVHAERTDTVQFLVYSDWLTDQNDARGEYLRLRVALLRLTKARKKARLVKNQLAELERAHLSGFAWWLRLLGLVPVSDELLQASRQMFREWPELTMEWRLRG